MINNMLETIIYNPILLVGLSFGIYELILRNIIPKFPGRRRISAGIISSLLIQAALIIFTPLLGVDLPTLNDFKLLMFFAIGGAVIREAFDKMVE